jgi:hypothetical protein
MDHQGKLMPARFVKAFVIGNIRRHSFVGDLSPAEFERRYALSSLVGVYETLAGPCRCRSQTLPTITRPCLMHSRSTRASHVVY